MKKLFLLLSLAMGCTTVSWRPINVSNGDNGWMVDCQGNMPACFNKAEELCPAGYRIWDGANKEDYIPYRAESGGMLVPTRHGAMLISCRKVSYGERL